jgi:hypothetical protein
VPFGSGLAFGSRKLAVTEVTMTIVDSVPANLQQDVLVFDRWVRNMDRTLTPRGGDPNLFVQPVTRELVVLDHNLAFDESFSTREFFVDHIFRDQRMMLMGDFLRRDDYNARLSSALAHWQTLLAELPPEWWFLDKEMTVPVDFDPLRVYGWLAEHQHDDFWKWQ